MESNELQKQFFTQLKGRLPQHLSMVDEIAELLNISNDSSYRRIRGENVSVPAVAVLLRGDRWSLEAQC